MSQDILNLPQPEKNYRNKAPEKTPWTIAEDKIIVDCKRDGASKWSQISKHIPGRTGKQIRERWQNQLDPELSKDPWKDEEDELLCKLQHHYGNRWMKISKEMKGRSENAVKNRWNSSPFKKFRDKLELESNSIIVQQLASYRQNIATSHIFKKEDVSSTIPFYLLLDLEVQKNLRTADTFLRSCSGSRPTGAPWDDEFRKKRQFSNLEKYISDQAVAGVVSTCIYCAPSCSGIGSGSSQCESRTAANAALGAASASCTGARVVSLCLQSNDLWGLQNNLLHDTTTVGDSAASASISHPRDVVTHPGESPYQGSCDNSSSVFGYNCLLSNCFLGGGGGGGGGGGEVTPRSAQHPELHISAVPHQGFHSHSAETAATPTNPHLHSSSPFATASIKTMESIDTTALTHPCPPATATAPDPNYYLYAEEGAVSRGPGPGSPHRSYLLCQDDMCHDWLADVEADFDTDHECDDDSGGMMLASTWQL